MVDFQSTIALNNQTDLPAVQTCHPLKHVIHLLHEARMENILPSELFQSVFLLFKCHQCFHKKTIPLFKKFLIKYGDSVICLSFLSAFIYIWHNIQTFFCKYGTFIWHYSLLQHYIIVLQVNYSDASCTAVMASTNYWSGKLSHGPTYLHLLF